MSSRLDNSRIIRAPHGNKLSAKSWQTEAPLRMLMNNLDPEVAEKPQELVVYGGIGRAARNWESYDRIVTALTQPRRRRNLAACNRASRWASFAPIADAPRVLIANSNLVPHWGNLGQFQRTRSQGPDDVRPDDGGLVDLHRHPRASCRAPTRPSSRSAASTMAAISPANGF